MGARFWAIILLVGLAAVVFLPRQALTVRDVAIAIPEGRPTAPLRISILGTSLTENYEWPDHVADGLVACLGYRPQLSRVAQAGANSTWGLRQIQAVIAKKPDILLIEFAINDADLRDGVWLSQSADNHLAMIRAVQMELPEARIVLMTMSPAQGLRGWMRPRLGSYYAQYQELARQTNAGVIDLYPRWLALSAGHKGLVNDGLHPDKNVANGLIVPVVLAYLKSAISLDTCQF